MDAGIPDVAAVRQEMLNLLRHQLEVLDSPLGLTEDLLRDCYIRQTRVQELREILQAASDKELRSDRAPDAIPVASATDMALHHAASSMPANPIFVEQFS